MWYYPYKIHVIECNYYVVFIRCFYLKFYILLGDEYSIMIIKILRWLYYGVILSVVPFTLVLVRNWVIGNQVPKIDYFLDLLLITFAIAINALNIVTDKAKQIWEEMRIVCRILSSLSVIFCIAMYFSFFEYCYINDKLLEQFMEIDYSIENITLNEDAFQEFEMLKQLVEELSPKNEQLVIFIIISVVILVVNAIIGIVVEVVDDYRGKAQHEDQGKGGDNENVLQNSMKVQS